MTFYGCRRAGDHSTRFTWIVDDKSVVKFVLRRRWPWRHSHPKTCRYGPCRRRGDDGVTRIRGMFRNGIGTTTTPRLATAWPRFDLLWWVTSEIDSFTTTVAIAFTGHINMMNWTSPSSWLRLGSRIDCQQTVTTETVTETDLGLLRLRIGNKGGWIWCRDRLQWTRQRISVTSSQRHQTGQPLMGKDGSTWTWVSKQDKIAMTTLLMLGSNCYRKLINWNNARCPKQHIFFFSNQCNGISPEQFPKARLQNHTCQKVWFVLGVVPDPQSVKFDGSIILHSFESIGMIFLREWANWVSYRIDEKNRKKSRKISKLCCQTPCKVG